jgi:hypothetical protein
MRFGFAKDDREHCPVKLCLPSVVNVTFISVEMLRVPNQLSEGKLTLDVKDGDGILACHFVLADEVRLVIGPLFTNELHYNRSCCTHKGLNYEPPIACHRSAVRGRVTPTSRIIG